MDDERFPGFTAEESLYNTTGRYAARPVRTSLSFNREHVHPAQTWLETRLGRTVLGRVEQLPADFMARVWKTIECRANCYSNCIKRYPDAHSFCSFASHDCCVNGSHCSYCDP